MKVVLVFFLLWTVVFADLTSTHASTKEKKELEENAEHPHQWVLELKDQADPLQVARDHNLEYEGAVKGLPHFHLFKSKPERRRHHQEVESRLESDSKVTFFEAQHKRRRFKRSLRVTDPSYGRQWHLHGTSQSNIAADIGWQQERTGKGVNVAIVDDGLQWAHPDLREGYKRELSTDINDGDGDPTPFTGDGHGTSAAGACCARANSVCGVGTAPESGLVGIRLIAEPTADYEEALGLSYKDDQIHIYSNSWGPYDDASSLEQPGRVTQEMFEQKAQTGRGGKGSIWVWAGGNGRDNGDNCNYDGYANSRYTIAIGALGHDVKQAWYSESCAALVACAPSSGTPGYGITTTDLLGSDGYNPNGDCTNSFGGTSAAAPIAAGAVALMLEERPDLRWRDVQHVLAKSSTKIDPNDPDWTTNDRGFHHNHKYGFGLINVPEMLRVAKEHSLVPKDQKMCTSGRIEVSKWIPDTGTWTYQQTSLPSYHCQGGARTIDFVEHVELVAYVSHSRRGQVEVTLEGPDGTKSVLAEKHGDYHRNYPAQGWTFRSMRHFGSKMTGQWSIGLRDGLHDGNQGNLKWFELVVHGY